MYRGFYRGYGGFGRGGGGGNPYPYCRFFPWLPRRWWAYPANAQQYMAPYPPVSPLMPPSFPGYSKEQENQMLTQQIQILESQLESLKKRLEELKT